MRELSFLTAFFFSLPSAIVSIGILVGVILEPIGISRELRLALWLLPLVLVPVSFLVTIGEMKIKSPITFTVVFALSSLLIAACSVAAGIFIHRDYFTSAFQTIMCMPAVFFFRAATNEVMQAHKDVQRALSRAGFVLSMFYGIWIMLMGYAIVTRAEPRPLESSVYNMYNLVLSLFLLAVSRQLLYRSCTSLESSQEKILVNGKDVTQQFGQKKTRLVYAFLNANERRLCCPEIQKILQEDQKEAATLCARCREESIKATLCIRYRTTYNLILDLKKSLESLELGTITANGNRRNILAEGWKLILFENVRLSVKKNTPSN